MGLIYHAFDTINGKAYVGQTTRLFQDRQSEHLDEARLHPKYPFHRAIRKRGSQNFVWTILATSSIQDELDAAETFFIKKFETLFPNGYNMTEGPTGHLSESTKKLLSARLKGRPKSPEHKIAISLGKKGKSFSTEHIAKLSLAKLGKRSPRSPSHSAAISASKKGKAWSLKHRAAAIEGLRRYHENRRMEKKKNGQQTNQAV